MWVKLTWRALLLRFIYSMHRLWFRVVQLLQMSLCTSFCACWKKTIKLKNYHYILFVHKLNCLQQNLRCLIWLQILRGKNLRAVFLNEIRKLICCYFSRYIEVVCVHNSSNAGCAIVYLKSIFAGHGIPEILISDNGPTYNFCDLANFARAFGTSLAVRIISGEMQGRKEILICTLLWWVIAQHPCIMVLTVLNFLWVGYQEQLCPCCHKN